MSIGYIKLHRSLLEWQHWDDHNTTRLLIYLLVKVNYENKKWKGIDIKAGSVVTSYEKLSIAVGLSISQIRRSLIVLENDKQIDRKTTNKNQLISLIKWGELQIEEKKTAGKRQTNTQLKDRETTTTKEDILLHNISEETKKERMNERKLKFADTLKPFLSVYGKDLLNDFYFYWSEPNQSNTKMRFEMQKTWSIELRLKKWSNNDKNFISKKDVKPYNPRS